MYLTTRSRSTLTTDSHSHSHSLPFGLTPLTLCARALVFILDVLVICRPVDTDVRWSTSRSFPATPVDVPAVRCSLRHDHIIFTASLARRAHWSLPRPPFTIHPCCGTGRLRAYHVFGKLCHGRCNSSKGESCKRSRSWFRLTKKT